MSAACLGACTSCVATFIALQLLTQYHHPLLPLLQVLTLVVVADKKPTTAAKALASVMGEQQRVVGRCRLRLSTLLPNRATTCLLTLQVG
jgi:hypothetical protein